jgi:hypothetical protein
VGTQKNWFPTRSLKSHPRKKKKPVKALTALPKKLHCAKQRLIRAIMEM